MQSKPSEMGLFSPLHHRGNGKTARELFARFCGRFSWFHGLFSGLICADFGLISLVFSALLVHRTSRFIACTKKYGDD